MVKMFKRGNGKLYLEYEAYGKIIQKSTRLQDTPQNRALVKKEVIPALQQKILRGDFNKDKPDIFRKYSEIYLKEKSHLKTANRVEKHIGVINDFFGDIQIDQLKRSDVKEWIQIQLENVVPKTVSNYLTSVRGVIDIAIDKEVIKHNVATGIKLPTHYSEDIEPFSEQEVRLLFNNANEFLKLYLAIGFYTGMRTGEILGLMYSDIDFDKKVIYVKRSISEGKVTTPKTRSSIREVPILDDLLPYLKKPARSLWIFSRQDGTRLGRFGENRYREWHTLLDTCHLKYRKPYTTRHTFIVSMLKYSDLSVMEIAQIVGHTTTQMIIQNYAKYIKGEQLRLDRKLKLFTDKSADSTA
jgi:integrase